MESQGLMIHFGWWLHYLDYNHTFLSIGKPLAKGFCSKRIRRSFKSRCRWNQLPRECRWRNRKWWAGNPPQKDWNDLKQVAYSGDKMNIKTIFFFAWIIEFPSTFNWLIQYCSSTGLGERTWNIYLKRKLRTNTQSKRWLNHIKLILPFTTNIFN